MLELAAEHHLRRGGEPAAHREGHPRPAHGRVPVARPWDGSTGPRDARRTSTPKQLRAHAARMRALDLVSIHAAGSGHPGGTLSVMDIAAVLFLDEVRHDPADPRWEGRDRVFFSAGHKAPALYVGARRGRVPRRGAGRHPAQARQPVPGPSPRPGAAGRRGVQRLAGPGARHRGRQRPGRAHGGRGLARVLRHGRRRAAGGQHLGGRDERGHYRLDNLCAIVDKNRLQIDGLVSAVMDVDPLADKYRAFGWNVIAWTATTSGGSRTRSVPPARRRAGRRSSSPTPSRARASPSWRTRRAGTAWPRRASSSSSRPCARSAPPPARPSTPATLLAAAEEFQKRVDATLAKELPRFARD